MNAHVHYTLTRRWARDTGFDDAQAEEIARWDVGTDRVFPGDRREFLPYHWSRQGADDLAEAYLARAIRDRDVRYLGVALHCAQDSVAHGRLNRLLHWPGIDIWQRRRVRVRDRMEHRTKEILRTYLTAAAAASNADPNTPDASARTGDSVPELPSVMPDSRNRARAAQ